MFHKNPHTLSSTSYMSIKKSKYSNTSCSFTHLYPKMASLLHLSPIFLTLFLHALLASPAQSLTCTSQTFPTKYANCSDLPTLKAYLHWTYDPTNSSLSIAFIAPPAKADGWIAWGINPISTGMIGTQALIAFKDDNDTIVVKTYNLTSYRSIDETSKLSFQVLDSKAEFTNGTMKIFATLTLPKNMTELNQVWQVGADVDDGVPQKHAFAVENLSAKQPLSLGSTVVGNNTSVAAGGTVGGDKNGTATPPVAESGNSTSPNGAVSMKFSNGAYGILAIFAALFLGF